MVPLMTVTCRSEELLHGAVDEAQVVGRHVDVLASLATAARLQSVRVVAVRRVRRRHAHLRCLPPANHRQVLARNSQSDRHVL